VRHSTTRPVVEGLGSGRPRGGKADAMRRSRGFTVIALLAVVAVIALAATLVLTVSVRARENARKATCIANIKSLGLYCLMYAADNDEVLPACVADDTDGTAHAVGGVYKNWTVAAMRRDIKRKYGKKYADGRWMWQLGDALAPGGYLKSQDIVTCPTLARVDPRFKVGIYVVGTDKDTGAPDPNDPLLAHLPGIRADLIPGERKVWQSGSYVYMCMHHPYGAGVRAGDYGDGILTLWDVGNLLGYVGKFGSLDAANPQDRLACGNKLDALDDPAREPLVMCRSYGVHERRSLAYSRRHVIPPELAPLFGWTEREVRPTVPIATPVAFVDGHAKYVEATFYDMLALVLSPNKLPPRARR
jgi:competence protein ComGC